MSSWHHIPVHSVSEEDMFEDPFDENLEMTFPPLRYMPLFYDRPPSNTVTSKPLRRESSRERERLYRELVGHEPYRPIMKKQVSFDNNDGKFKILLDVKHYKPDEITMKVDGNSLIILGKHHNETENGFDSSEFQRKYTIPDYVDAHALTSNITPSGVLCVEARPNAKQKSGNDVVLSDENFQISLDVSGYSPDEISVRVNHHELIIHGETKDEHDHGHGKSTHHQQFTRRFTLPEDVDVEALSSRYSKDCKIIVVAPRNGASSELRQLEIIQD